METVRDGNFQREQEEPTMNGVESHREGAQNGEEKNASVMPQQQQQQQQQAMTHYDSTMPPRPEAASMLSAIHEKPRSIRQITPNGHSNSLSLEGYLPSQHTGRSPSRHPLSMATVGSTQSSSGSLQALSEHEGADTTIKRKQSTRSNPNRGRSISHSKVASTPQTLSKRTTYSDRSFYPDQSFAQLSNPPLTARPHPILRTRSSHPAQNILYNEMSHSKSSTTPGRRTADNTPMSSPGLFAPQAIRQAAMDSGRSGIPQLHHLQTPKETHTAEIEHDTFSGNKFINNYEVISELGRGEHGKVKLGRDIERGSMVAIKIVPRYSTKRRLGKLGAPEDRTKREVAILKKARHSNVVSLLEVIDDPSKNKVYLILEYVEKGEIKWRKTGVREILAVNKERFEQERLGAYVDVDPTDRDRHIVRQAQHRYERLEYQQTQNRELNQIPNWSLEYAGDTDDESDMVELSRTVSRQLTNTSIPSRGNSQDDYVGYHDGAGNMYGAYAAEAYGHRKFSVAASAISHMSSDFGFEQDDAQYSYVPALTLEEAQRAFRDTLLGLEFLHYIGIIHRDIKPANLLSCGNGMVKISDFGVSYLGRPTTDEEAERSGTDDTPLDDEKELARSVGTPAFWAPELCYEDASMFADGKDPKITGALDLWALGITLYCMVYARLPFYYSNDMGLHEAICKAEVFCPRTRLVPVDTTSSKHVLRSAVPINGNKRLDYELKFEVVPDNVRDLIRQLLIKDPAQRISIAQAKRHSWVVEGLSNESEWLQGPIEKEGKRQIFDINERELSHAVGKRNIIERALTTASRIAGNLLGRKDSRKRASSMATSAGSSSESLYSPALSPASTIGKQDKIREARRTSLRGDEVLQALKSSREPGEHPLAQSQTASPETKAYQPQEYFGVVNDAMHGMTPITDSERRPRGPDRAVSALSNADSIKTIRASQMQRAIIDPLASVESPSESTLKARVEGLWEGTTRTLNRLASRDRQSSSRGPRGRSQSRTPSEHDGRAEPSLAVSNTYAAGAISTPNALKGSDQPSDIESSSLPRSITDMPHRAMFHAPISSEAEFEQAQIINQRRYLQEVQQSAQTASNNEAFASALAIPCPPSPDDKSFADLSILTTTEEDSHVVNGGIQTAASASTIASSVEGGCDSSVSDPSYGIASGASSPPEMFLSAEYKDLSPHGLNKDIEPEFMRTADTVTLHGGPATATAKALEQQHEFYDDVDDNYGDDADDSDDDGGIIMSGPKRN